MNDVTKAFDQYSLGLNAAKYYGDSKGIETFSQYYVSGFHIDHERPDMVVINENVTLLIEHFEFDSYLSNRKGSQNKQEQGRIDREHKYQYSEVFHDQVNGTSSYDYYWINLKENFINHYNKILEYKRRVTKEKLAHDSQSIIMTFVIQDSSPLGSISTDKEGNVYYLTPAHCREFIELLEDKKELDYIVCLSEYGNEQSVWFIDMNSIDEYKQRSVDYRNLHFISFKPQVIGTNFEIADPHIKEL